jgi:glycosyltransferase involved in cell wall biosynthesis
MGRAIVDRSRRGSHLVQVSKLVRDFRRERPSVVVAWGHEICVTTFVATAIAGVPHIVFCIRTVNPTYGWTSQSFAALLLAAHRRVTGAVDRIIVNSTLLREDHARWVGIDPAGIAVCANGIDVEARSPGDLAATRSRIRGELGIADDAVVISNVGRFSPEKGQLSLVEANRALTKAAGRPVVLLLCGDGPTLPDARARVQAEGMTNVIFTGRTDAVQHVLTASDIFVMPSDFEGMPNAMMEAMAEGLPCVSTTSSGIRDIARDGIEALYYEPGDMPLLVEHLQTLVENPGRARTLGAAAAARIREFSVPRFVECFERILDELPTFSS